MPKKSLVVKEGSKVLWLDTLHNRNEVETGTVISVWGTAEKPVYNVLWLEGYKSRNDDVTPDRILAIADPKGPEMQLDGFTGRGYLTEAGKRWKAAHPTENPMPELQPEPKVDEAVRRSVEGKMRRAISEDGKTMITTFIIN